MVELNFTPNRIITEIAKVAGVNMADFVSIDNEGNPHIDLSGVKRRQLAAVSAVEGPLVEDGRVMKAPKIRMHDKLKALDMLAKLSRMYPLPPSGPPLGTRICPSSTMSGRPRPAAALAGLGLLPCGLVLPLPLIRDRPKGCPLSKSK